MLLFFQDYCTAKNGQSNPRLRSLFGISDLSWKSELELMSTDVELFSSPYFLLVPYCAHAHWWIHTGFVRKGASFKLNVSNHSLPEIDQCACSVRTRGNSGEIPMVVDILVLFPSLCVRASLLNVIRLVHFVHPCYPALSVTNINKMMSCKCFDVSWLFSLLDSVILLVRASQKFSQKTSILTIGTCLNPTYATYGTDDWTPINYSLNLRYIQPSHELIRWFFRWPQFRRTTWSRAGYSKHLVRDLIKSHLLPEIGLLKRCKSESESRLKSDPNTCLAMRLKIRRLTSLSNWP